MRAPRMWDWSLAAAVAVAVVWALAPQQIEIIAYKGSLLTLAAVAGYYLDRALFPYARPHRFDDPDTQYVFAFSMMRRAVVIAAALLSVGLAL